MHKPNKFKKLLISCLSLSLGTLTVPKAQDFSVVIIPDTQYMTMDAGTGDCSHVRFLQQCMGLFWKQANWIAASADKLNIKYVAHVGDMVEDGHNEVHWVRADGPMTKIQSTGIPFGLSPGNHDFDYWNGDNWNWTRLTSHNKWFPKDRYQKNVVGFQDGFPAGTAENHYTFFTASELEFMVLNIQYNPGTPVRTWAESILKKYPNKRVILSTHDVNSPGIYDLANKNENVFLVVSGHHCAREWTKKNTRSNGSVWMDIMSDYQGDGTGGWGGCNNGNGGKQEGLLRYYQFKPSENKIYAYTYSPLTNTFKTIPSSQFSWDYKMEKPVSVFSSITSAQAASISFIGKELKVHTTKIPIISIKLFNNLGTQVLYSKSAPGFNHTLNLPANMPQGVYFVELQDITKQKRTFKIIR